MNRAYFRQRLKYYLRRYWPLLLAVGLIVIAAWVYVFVIRPLQVRNIEIRLGLQEAKVLARLASRQPVRHDLDPQTKVVGFYQMLPLQPTLPEQLSKLYREAQRDELPLITGEYKVIVDAPTGVWIYQIKLPVKGSYKHIRHFINQALVDNPALALELAVFSRESIATDNVQANLQFALYFRRDGAR
jgi:hypothetical protein